MHFIPVETPGGTIWAEVDEFSDTDGISLTSSKAFKSFEDAVSALKKNAASILSTLQDLGPEAVEVTFGIKVGAEGGTPFFGLAKASGEASYSVKVTWKSG